MKYPIFAIFLMFFVFTSASQAQLASQFVRSYIPEHKTNVADESAKTAKINTTPNKPGYSKTTVLSWSSEDMSMYEPSITGLVPVKYGAGLLVERPMINKAESISQQNYFRSMTRVRLTWSPNSIGWIDRHIPFEIHTSFIFKNHSATNWNPAYTTKGVKVIIQSKRNRTLF